MYKWILTIALIFLLTACHHGNPWAQKTADTLDLIRAHLLTEAPGPVDASNPAFMKDLSAHYQQALLLSKNVTNDTGYYQVIHSFVSSFDDSNIRLNDSRFPLPLKSSVSSFSWQHLTPNLVWVSIPTFLLENSDDIAWARKIITLAPTLRDEKTVVIDLRGNAQGDFDWGRALLQTLYGPHYYQWRLQQALQVFNQYRVSDYAVMVLQQQTQQLKQVFGPHSQVYQSSKTLLNAMSAVLERGDQLYPASLLSSSPSASTLVLQSAYRGQLVILVDGHCNNACLDFISVAQQLPRVKLLGQVTDANTFYTHSSVPVYLGDGLELHFGYVIERYRARASHQPYVPDRLYSGNMQDTTALQQWVLKVMD